MAGAGIAVRYDKTEFQKILDALSRMAHPDRFALSRFMGEELEAVGNQAFEDKADPATGKRWEPLRAPREDGTTGPLLQYRNHLHDSRSYRATTDGVVYGTNLVYGAVHQEGGQTKAHEIRPVSKKALSFGGRIVKKAHHPGSKIPARPYMGVPADFDRRILNDPAVQKLLGVTR